MVLLFGTFRRAAGGRALVVFTFRFCWGLYCFFSMLKRCKVIDIVKMMVAKKKSIWFCVRN